MNRMRVMIAMAALLGGGVASVEAQPLFQYTFNDGTATDFSGNGFVAALLKTAAIVKDAERGQVLQVNQGGMRADGPFAITKSFTLSMWVKIDQPRTGRAYSGGPWTFRTDNQTVTEHYWIEFRYPTGTFVDKFDSRTPDNSQGQLDGKWHHYIFRLDEAGQPAVYVDGVPAPSRDNGKKAYDFGGAIASIFFGTENEAGTNALKGYMDDIRLYNYAMADADIAGLMIEGLGPEYASNPSPPSGVEDIARDVVLGWSAGEFAKTHDVYFGSTFEDVDKAGASSALLVSKG